MQDITPKVQAFSCFIILVLYAAIEMF